MKGLLHSNNGSAMVLVAICAMLILFGATALAVDVGYMYSERAKMVTAADAAALAGARRLTYKGVKAEEVIESAVAAAEANGVEPARVQVQVFVDKKEVEVTVSETKGLFFARTMGEDESFREAEIGAIARAKAGPYKGGNGIVPIGIIQSDIVGSEDGEIIKFGAGDGEKGNYHALNMNIINNISQGYSNGADFYETCFKNGSPMNVYIGDTIGPEKGNIAGPTAKSVKERIDGGKDLIVVPVINGFKQNEPVKVLGFAVFRLLAASDEGTDKGAVWGTFEHIIVSGEMGEGEGYGVYVVKLIK